MDFTYLGRTGLQVSRLCLGTMNFGPRTSEEDSHAIMDMAHDVGINFFDTANRYGTEPGETETIIGDWFASGGGRRELAPAANRLRRSVPVPPCGSEHPVGGDLAGDRGRGTDGQDPLRRE